MATSSRYCTKFRRRRQGKTDYHARKAFLLSGKPRLVARSSIKNIIAQIIIAKPDGDHVIASSHSRELAKYGWKASGGNIPAAYLTGLLCGLKANKAGIKEAILDIGLYPPVKGSRIFAVLAGILDTKLNVPYSKEKLPGEIRIKGEHISKYAKDLASDVEKHKFTFLRYAQQGIAPEALPEHFEQVKQKMISAFRNRGNGN